MAQIDSRRIEVIDDEMAEVLRAKTPAERVAMITAANRTARILAEGGARFSHPDWTDEQIRREVVRRVCGETMALLEQLNGGKRAE